MKILNQMAESSFFNFPSLKDSEQIAQPNDCLESEDEYDAFNDETFGIGCECGNWEQQHEKLAEFEKSSSKQDEIVDSLKDLVLSPSPLDLTGNSVWAYTPQPNQNGKTTPSDRSINTDELSRNGDSLAAGSTSKAFPAPFQVPPMSSPLSKICTVEELEKNLIKTNHNSPPNNRPPPGYRPMVPPPNFYLPFPRPPIPPTFQGHAPQHSYQMGPNRYPPGFPPQNMAPPMRHVIYPPRYRPMPPSSPHHAFMKGGNMQQRPPPGIPYPHQLNQGHIQRAGMHIMPPHLQMLAAEHQYHNQQHMQYHQHQNENLQMLAKSYRERNVVRDEYEGLMTSREKQWLLNIQLLQLNTGTPYFDDYYYTIYKERKARNTTKEYQLQRHQAGPRTRRNSDRQENNPLTPKVYTPQQFENSLGKLQCGSVMAPRKIIDMDVVSCEKDADCSTGPSSKDTRKTKQLLLELEVLYTMFLKAEDLTNPLAISNLKTLKDIRLKQRIRELENATTQEQKREILETVKRESESVPENPQDYMQKIVQGLLQEDKFTSFLNIRKGKMLLLRLLPTLHPEQYYSQVTEIWSRLLSSLPIIGRRDTVGDKILPKFYPLFKRYSITVKMSNILDIIQGLTETTRLDNSRSTPLGHQSKAPLYFVLMNQFGISAMTALFVRSEYLIATDSATEAQQMALFNFIQTAADTLSTLPKISSPLERMSLSTFEKLSQRIPHLNPDKFQILKKHFVESEE